MTHPDDRRPRAFGWKTQLFASILVLLSVFLVYRRWKETRTHKITFRALSGHTCTVRVESRPNVVPRDDGGLLTSPWYEMFEAPEGADLQLQVSGGADCETVTCEIFVGENVVARNASVSAPGGGVSICHALSVHHD